MHPSSTSPELRRFLSEAVAPLEPLLVHEGFELTASSHVGRDAKTGMSICFAIFSSPTMQVQVSHEDGAVSIHIAETAALAQLARPPEWRNVHALASTREQSIEELLRTVPSRPKTIAEQVAELAALLGQYFRGTAPAP